MYYTSRTMGGAGRDLILRLFLIYRQPVWQAGRQAASKKAKAVPASVVASEKMEKGGKYGGEG